MRALRRGITAITALVLTLLATGCDARKEGKTVTDPFVMPALATVCVGHHLIDLPEELQLRGEAVLYYGLTADFTTVEVRVLQAKGPESAFSGFVETESARAAGRYSARTPNKNYLANQREIGKFIHVIRVHKEPVMKSYYDVHVLARIGEAVGRFTATVYDDDKPEDIEAKVLAIVQKTSYMTNPTEQKKGTCIGPLVIDAGQDGERFNLGTRGTKHTDLSLEFSINSLLAETDGGLLARVDSKAAIIKKLGGNATILRRGKIAIADRPAEELADEDKGQEETIRRHFAAETLLSKPSTFAEPQIYVRMYLGGQIETGKNQFAYIDPSINKKDSLALWDAIVKSIRPRVGAL